MCSSDAQPLNASFSITVTVDGISNSLRNKHPSNADFPIDLVDCKIDIFIIDAQFLNVLSNICSIDDGIIISLIDEHPQNVYPPIIVTDEGISI